MEVHCSDNFTDEYAEDSPHVYSSVNIPGRGCNLEQFETQICNSCSCSENDCSVENSCACIKLSHGNNYTFVENQLPEVKIVSEIKLTSVLGHSYSVFECNDLCSCSSTCVNRLTQFGPRKSLIVQNDPKKGLCLFTNSLIHKGEFICEYAGELISKEEAKLRFESDLKSDKMNYIFVLREIFADEVLETIIDPSYIGNIGRYINHSCNPNAAIIPVRVNSVIPKLAIFALTDIDVNKEITMSYSTATSSVVHAPAQNRRPCYCFEDNCTKYLPYDGID